MISNRYVLDRSGHQTDLRSDIFSLVNLATTPYLYHLILIQKGTRLRNCRTGFTGTDLPAQEFYILILFCLSINTGVEVQSFQNLKIFLTLKYLSQRLLVYKALLLLLMLYVIASLVVLKPMCM